MEITSQAIDVVGAAAAATAITPTAGSLPPAAPGAPLVAAGGKTPAVDASGLPACEICRKRLRSDKKDEPHNVGRAHCACVLRKARDVAWDPLAPTATPPAQRSHKKRALSPLPLPGIFDGVDLSHLQRENKKRRLDEAQHQKRVQVAVELLTMKRTLKVEETAREHVAAVKGRHVEGMLGAESVFQLTGPELSRWVKQQRDEALARHADTLLRPRARVRFVLGGQQQQLQPLPLTTPAARIRTMGSWTRLLHDLLLHRNKWTSDDVDTLEAVQQDIWKRWERVTLRPPTPKVHVLKHTMEFARRFKVLGLLSEAQMEACHAPFNKAYNHTHCNCAHDEAERLRRSHVEILLTKLPA